MARNFANLFAAALVFAGACLSLAAAVPPDPSSTSYQAGRTDRSAWETWYQELSGARKEGAGYWAEQRSLKDAVPCENHSSYGDAWLTGCKEARTRLTQIDLRRRTDAQYWNGWNGIVSQSQAEPEKRTTEAGRGQKAPQSSSDGGTSIIWLIIAGAAVSITLITASSARKARKRALGIITAEISSNAESLRIRRMQLVIPDAYGTSHTGKWEKEKAYYITTRILPQLYGASVGTQYRKLAGTINQMIENTARQSFSYGRDVDSFRSSPEVFDSRMNPIDYEHHCALLLERVGWQTQLTKVTGDQGADVIATKDGKKLVLQCKLYSNPVGNDAVQQVFAAKAYQNADAAAVVSNQPYTPAARSLAGVNGVLLIHHEQLPGLSL